MARYVALLRGINVGGKNTVAMADLRAWVSDLGHTDVATYINSGNVVFTSGTPQVSDAGLAAAIEEKIAAESGLRIAVMVRAEDELSAALSANPFRDSDPSRVLIAFMDQPPDAATVESWHAVESGDDEARAIGPVVYLHFPDGMGRSKLGARVLGSSAAQITTRNIRTVSKLLEMVQAGGR